MRHHTFLFPLVSFISLSSSLLISSPNPLELHIFCIVQLLSGDVDTRTYCLRARIDMASLNGTLRDPVLYRWTYIPHVTLSEKALTGSCRMNWLCIVCTYFALQAFNIHHQALLSASSFFPLHTNVYVSSPFTSSHPLLPILLYYFSTPPYPSPSPPPPHLIRPHPFPDSPP